MEHIRLFNVIDFNLIPTVPDPVMTPCWCRKAHTMFSVKIAYLSILFILRTVPIHEFVSAKILCRKREVRYVGVPIYEVKITYIRL